MDSDQISSELVLTPDDNRRLMSLRGQCDENLFLLERTLDIAIHVRGNTFHLKGAPSQVNLASRVLKKLYQETTVLDTLSADHVQLILREKPDMHDTPDSAHPLKVKTKNGQIKPRTPHQKDYIEGIQSHDLCFGVGPAGTGKTYLAVACAVDALESQAIRRLLLVRPAVEAGERLGFLPGDLSQKIDPYCRPLYDALYDMLGFERVQKLIERQVIEVAPLAYMRGRTLNDAYIILDEGQNTTKEQMKMFLTRMGANCTVVVTGDPSQVDLPKGQESGLQHALKLLKKIDGIHFTEFTSQDVVRHALVQHIIEAYEKHENRKPR